MMDQIQPLQQEKAPPDIYVNADSFNKKFARYLTVHYDFMMKRGPPLKGRSLSRAFHAGIRTTGPDMIGAGTCFGRKTESWRDFPANYLKLLAYATLTVALYNADDDFLFRRIHNQALKIQNNGNRIDALQKCRWTKYMAVPDAHFEWSSAVWIFKSGSSPSMTKKEIHSRFLACTPPIEGLTDILSPGSNGTMGRSSSWIGLSSCIRRPAAGISTTIPKFSERERWLNHSIFR